MDKPPLRHRLGALLTRTKARARGIEPHDEMAQHREGIAPDIELIEASGEVKTHPVPAEHLAGRARWNR